MQKIKQQYEVLTKIDRTEILKFIEKVGRTCYKSEGKITETSAPAFVKMLVKRDHGAMLEFYDIVVKLICSRGVTHQLVRHRLASYAQESTHYCNYNTKKFNYQIKVIDPVYWDNKNELKDLHEEAMRSAELYYRMLIEKGAASKDARSVLPIGIKTEIVIKANLREWMHIFTLRTSKHAHTEIKALLTSLLENVFKKELPEIFGHINSE